MLPLTDKLGFVLHQRRKKLSRFFLFFNSIIALKTGVLQKIFTSANVEANLFIGFDRMIADNF